MTIAERTKQLRYRKAIAILIIINIVCWVPVLFKYHVFGLSNTVPGAGASAYLLDLATEPVIDEAPVEVVEEPPVEKIDTSSYEVYSPSYLKKHGVIYWSGYKYTWYSQRVLPGGGLKIPGRHVSTEGYVMDEDGYICGASQLHKKGTIIESPFGHKIKIYDWCDIDSIDIYTDF